MVTKEQGFLSRIKDSFLLFVKNFLGISLYYIIFVIISGITLSLLGNYIFSIAFKFVNVNKDVGIDANTYINIGYFAIIYGFIALSIAILKIPFYISLVKNIENSFNGELVNKNTNLKYGFTSIGKIFNTYWYIFKYVVLIPSLILIIGLLVVFVDQFIGTLIIILSLIVFIYFAIFRGLRSFLSLIYAIVYNDFSNDNFKKSIFLTKNNIGSIFWNIIGLAIFFWFIGFIISKFINLSTFDMSSIYSIIGDIYLNKETINMSQKMTELVTLLTPETKITLIGLSKSIISIIKDSLFYIFGLIFYFLLMKKFEQRLGINQTDTIKN
ncbi:MAG: hypothetical protein WC850_00495 [Candidatus Gracilibacteria bacterium]